MKTIVFIPTDAEKEIINKACTDVIGRLMLLRRTEMIALALITLQTSFEEAHDINLSAISNKDNATFTDNKP